MESNAVPEAHPIARSGKDLILATRPFAEEIHWKSWWYTLSTFALLSVCVGISISTLWMPLRIGASVAAGFVTVRAFVIYHDFMHRAILRGSRIAQVIFSIFGLLVLTPSRVWRETHNYHHAHNSKIVGSHIGSYPIATLSMWRQMTRSERIAYRWSRHPLNIALGLFTIFGYGMCFSSLRRHPAKHWDSGLAVVLHVILLSILTFWCGLDAYVLGMFVPLLLSQAFGAYLFYAQHNFPEVAFRSRPDWEYSDAALHSTSYMEMGPLWRWVTANIGYHHVHHINPTIPFYRLPEVMKEIDELQQPPATSLRPRDIVACFRLKLWDPESQEMVGFPTTTQR